MLTHHPPYPHTSGGRVRAYELLRRLGNKHEITLIYFYRPEDNNIVSIIHLNKLCRNVVSIPSQSLRLGEKMQLASIDPYWPSSCLPYVSNKAQKVIADLLDNGGFDLIYCVGYYIAHNLPKNLNIPVILGEDNIEYICAWRRFLHAKNYQKKVFALLDYLKEKRLEISTWKSVDACIVTSQIEKDIVIKSTATKVKVVPNGVDTFFFDDHDQMVNIKSRRYSVGMLANFRYPPNIDSFFYFKNHILPKLNLNYTNRILLIGNPGPELISEVNNDPRFIMTGQVHDIRPYLSNVDTIICPLRLGGGTKIKILESLAMRRTVITTEIGAEGFSVTNGRELLIANSPMDFSNTMHHALSNRNLRIQLGENGRSYVSSHHSWDTSALLLESFYQSVLLERNTATIMEVN